MAKQLYCLLQTAEVTISQQNILYTFYKYANINGTLRWVTFSSWRRWV